MNCEMLACEYLKQPFPIYFAPTMQSVINNGIWAGYRLRTRMGASPIKVMFESTIEQGRSLYLSAEAREDDDFDKARLMVRLF